MGVSIRTAIPGQLDTIVSIDEDAAQLYTQAGLHLVLADDHPFTVDERESWTRSIAAGQTFVAVDDAGGEIIGFAALEIVDGAPYLDQLSVRLSSMRQGTGRSLLAHAIAWARTRADALWLTTYAHLPWNRSFYEKEGFIVVPPIAHGAGIAARVAEQRRYLPAPDQRIVMRRSL